MTPTEWIHVLEQKRSSLYFDIAMLNNVIGYLQSKRHETTHDLEEKMTTEFGPSWRSLKRLLLGEPGQTMGKEPVIFSANPESTK